MAHIFESSADFLKKQNEGGKRKEGKGKGEKKGGRRLHSIVLAPSPNHRMDESSLYNHAEYLFAFVGSRESSKMEIEHRLHLRCMPSTAPPEIPGSNQCIIRIAP